MNPDQTDPSGAVWSVSILLAVVAIEVHQQAIVQMADIFCCLSVIFCVFNDTTNVIMSLQELVRASSSSLLVTLNNL